MNRRGNEFLADVRFDERGNGSVLEKKLSQAAEKAAERAAEAIKRAVAARLKASSQPKET